MPATNRLQIPLVNETDNISVGLWNNAYHRIDTLCTAIDIMENIQLDFTQSTSIEYKMTRNHPYKILNLVPHNSSDLENWKTINYAVIRAYIKPDDPTIIVLNCEGIRPTKEVTIDIIGWY